jgi:hypothetical protein
MRFTKKASLDLSINAIVILILAITMLGLGLAFMRNIFGSATKEFEEVSGTVKKQMIDQMKESTKIVDLSRPKVELKPGESTQVFIGFKNDGSKTKNFTIRSDPEGNPAATTPSSLSGTPNNCNLIGTQGVYLEFKLASTQVLKGDVIVLPINIKTSSGVASDTCFYELNIDYQEIEGGEPISGSVTTELTVDVTS